MDRDDASACRIPKSMIDRLLDHRDLSRLHCLLLTKMPPALFDSGAALGNLIGCIRDHCKEKGVQLSHSIECDLILGPSRLARVDAAFLTPEQKEKYKGAMERRRAGGAGGGSSESPSK